MTERMPQKQDWRDWPDFTHLNLPKEVQNHIDSLEFAIQDLRDTLVAPGWQKLRARFRISQGQAIVLATLASRDTASKHLLFATLRAHGCQAETTKIVDVHVSRLRKALHGQAEIETAWGYGFKLDQAGRDFINSMITGEADRP